MNPLTQVGLIVLKCGPKNSLDLLFQISGPGFTFWGRFVRTPRTPPGYGPGQEQQSCDFHTSVAPWCLIWTAPIYNGGALHSGKATFQSWSQDIRTIKLFKKIFHCFCTLCKSRYNLVMHALIWLKFGTHKIWSILKELYVILCIKVSQTSVMLTW